MNKLILLLAIIATLFTSSCDQEDQLRNPKDEEADEIKNIDDLLQYNNWAFNDLIIDVAYETRAPLLLANIADENGMVQAGKYDAEDIFGNTNRQDYYSYQFLNGKLYLDTTTNEEWYTLGTYNVTRSDEIIINIDSTLPIRYDYKYTERAGIFQMTTNQLGNAKINQAINKIVEKSIYTGKPGDIANNVVNKILENENIQDTIQQLLYDLVYGKLNGIAQNSDVIAQKLAEAIVDKLKDVDWEGMAYEKIVALLEELKIDNPEQVTDELVTQIVNRIETIVSEAEIYETILPILERFENETLPTLVPIVSEAVFNLIGKAFSEENIYNKIYPIWESFTEVDSSSIIELGDTLGTILTNHFFNVDTLTIKFEPFIATLRNTNTAKIPALAQDIINEVLIPLVDSLNASFPALELNPDWDAIKPVLTSVLTLIKSSIGTQTDAEAAASLAQSLIQIMDGVVSKAVENAIFYLQAIPANEASIVIAAWINNIVIMAEPNITAFIEAKLNELIELFNAEEIAGELASKISSKVLDLFAYENIYNLLSPLVERLSSYDSEAIAKVISDWLFDLDLVEDNVTEEEVVQAISDIIIELTTGLVNIDELTQKLVDLILQSNVVINIDGEVAKQLIEIKIYQLLLNIGKHMNAIETVELSIIKN